MERRLRVGAGWRAGLHTRRWDGRKSRSTRCVARPSAGCPSFRSRRPAPGAPHAQKRKPREDLLSSHVLSPGARPASDREAQPARSGASQPEATYSSTASQLRAARAGGAQTDVLAPTSLRTGVFALGRRTRGNTGGGLQPASGPRAACGRPSGALLPRREETAAAHPGQSTKLLGHLVPGCQGSPASCGIFSPEAQGPSLPAETHLPHSTVGGQQGPGVGEE